MKISSSGDNKANMQIIASSINVGDMLVIHCRPPRNQEFFLAIGVEELDTGRFDSYVYGKKITWWNGERTLIWNCMNDENITSYVDDIFRYDKSSQ
jgi:hypothetical protein